MLVLGRTKDQAVLLNVRGVQIRIVVNEFRKWRSGSPTVRLGFEAPMEVEILREELIQTTEEIPCPTDAKPNPSRTSPSHSTSLCE